MINNTNQVSGYPSAPQVRPAMAQVHKRVRVTA
jgi:hypothetical protein